jgi:kynurenine formamidase
MITDAQGNIKKALSGHLGTHFDVMDQEFPLEYVERKELGKLLNGKTDVNFIANTYPVNFADMTGLPCRVVAILPE